jgi:hypothetical protein
VLQKERLLHVKQWRERRAQERAKRRQEAADRAASAAQEVARKAKALAAHKRELRLRYESAVDASVSGLHADVLQQLADAFRKDQLDVRALGEAGALKVGVAAWVPPLRPQDNDEPYGVPASSASPWLSTAQYRKLAHGQGVETGPVRLQREPENDGHMSEELASYRSETDYPSRPSSMHEGPSSMHEGPSSMHEGLADSSAACVVFEAASEPAPHLRSIVNVPRMSLVPFHRRAAAALGGEGADQQALENLQASGFLEAFKGAVCRGKRSRSILEL